MIYANLRAAFTPGKEGNVGVARGLGFNYICNILFLKK